MGRPKKTDKTEAKSKEDQLRKVLSPFAEWAWGTQDGPKVVDKYFRQRPIKE